MELKIIGRKYSARCAISSDHPIQIVKTNGDAIREDEPLILFRGRDRLALPMLHAYRQICLDDGVTQYQIDALDLVIADFQKFNDDYPERMKQLGITLGQ